MSIASEISRLNTAKTDIKAALEGKGITVPSTLKIDGYAQLIENFVLDIRVVAKYNVTSTGNPTQLCYSDAVSQFSAIEIDGVAQPSVVSTYTFSTTGEHTVKYTLTDPTSIGVYAFMECLSLTSIEIPNSVTSIGEGTFYECSSLTSCTFDKNSQLTTIGATAFISCNGLTSIEIPSGVTSIGGNAFASCTSLTSIDIPNSVTTIGGEAFFNCTGLTTCTIGSGVTSIGNRAFRKCTSLTSITSNATTAPTIKSDTFDSVKTGGTLTVPSGSSGYDVWMGTGNYYLGSYGWTKVEQ